MTGPTPPGSYPPPPSAPPPPGGYPPPPPAYFVPPSNYPIQVDVPLPEQQSRVLALFSIPFFLVRYIALIPVFFCLYFVGIGAFVVAWLTFWAVLFTGRNPAGMHSFVAGYLRWSTRASAYMLGLTDKYPPFQLRP